jgi:Protein of unknown function (DUF455)
MLTPDAQLVCHPVAESQWHMEHFAFAARRSMELLATWVWTTPNLDAKFAFGRHAFEQAVHADLFGQRSTELRSGLPIYGWQPQPPDLPPIDTVFRRVVDAPSLPARLGAYYGSLLPWLLSRHQTYLQSADPILEGPSARLLEQVVAEERRQLTWGREQLSTLCEAERAEADAWRARVDQLLEFAPGRQQARTSSLDDPLGTFAGIQPASDPRMRLVYYTPGIGPSVEVDFGPQSEAESQQIMLCTLVSAETEAAELLCRILVEFPGLPWLMRLQLARQMWDECRHAASQRRILEGIGGSLGSWPAIAFINPLVGDEPDVLKRLIVLQRVVEGVSVDQHRPRGRYFLKQGMLPLVAMFDYVLADEDGHIALSRWIPQVAGDDPHRLRELQAYQTRKEREFSIYLDWLLSKRRDVQRLFPQATRTSAQT